MANAEHKKWIKRVAQYSEDHGEFPNQRFAPFQIHHSVGRKGKHNKFEIGEWFILPIEFQYHDVSSNNPFNITHWRKRYCIEFGNERDQFAAMCAVIKGEDGELPFSDDVYQAIMDTRR